MSDAGGELHGDDGVQRPTMEGPASSRVSRASTLTSSTEGSQGRGYNVHGSGVQSRGQAAMGSATMTSLRPTVAIPLTVQDWSQTAAASSATTTSTS